MLPQLLLACANNTCQLNLIHCLYIVDIDDVIQLNGHFQEMLNHVLQHDVSKLLRSRFCREPKHVLLVHVAER